MNIYYFYSLVDIGRISFLIFFNSWFFTISFSGFLVDRDSWNCFNDWLYGELEMKNFFLNGPFNKVFTIFDLWILLVATCVEIYGLWTIKIVIRSWRSEILVRIWDTKTFLNFTLNTHTKRHWNISSGKLSIGGKRVKNSKFSITYFLYDPKNCLKINRGTLITCPILVNSFNRKRRAIN